MSDKDKKTNGDDNGTRYGWLYLIFLFIVFLVLALSAYRCNNYNGGSDDSAGSTVTTSAEPVAEVSPDLTPVALTATVAGGQVTLTGAVPDDAARDQAVRLAEDRYGAGNVVDELTVDDGTTLDGGTMRVIGETAEGDTKPDELHADLASAFGLSSDGPEVTYQEVVLTPFAVTSEIASGQVTLAGEMPDQDSIDALVQISEETWGADNVDSSGLTIGENLTGDGGTVTVTGTVDAGDTRVGAYETALGGAFGGAVVDVDGVDIDTSAAALGRAEQALKDALAADPILFATGSAEIDSASDAILERAAAAITAAPGIAVEVVGHTDSQGPAGVNQILSADRASAVLDRLVELGVDADRLTSRGAGEDEPIDSNDTEEGRAANRRIAFNFEGAEEG